MDEIQLQNSFELIKLSIRGTKCILYINEIYCKPSQIYAESILFISFKLFASIQDWIFSFKSVCDDFSQNETE